MAVQVSYPGVYVQEVPSGVRTITGVSTSIAAFLGPAKRGPINRGFTITSYADFERRFGGLSNVSEMSFAVKQFFLNGGTNAVIVRLADNPVAAQTILVNSANANVLSVSALDAGKEGNRIEIRVSHQSSNPDSLFNLVVSYTSEDNPTDSALESFLNLSMNSLHARYVEEVVNSSSNLVRVTRLVSNAALTALPAAQCISGTLVDVGTLLDATHNRFQLMVNGLDPVQIQINVPAIQALGTPALRIAELCNQIKAQVINAGSNVALTGFNCVPNVATDRVVMTSGAGGEFSSIGVMPGVGNDASARLQLPVISGGRQIDGVATIQPVEVPLHSSITSGSITDALIDGPPAIFAAATKRRFRISIDGGIPLLVVISSPAIPANPIQTRLEQIALLIQGAVRALKPTTPAFRDFTCRFTAPDHLLLSAGSRGSLSSVVVSTETGDTLASDLRLVVTGGVGTATSFQAQNIMLQNGGEQDITDATRYAVFTGNQALRTGIFALDGVDLFNLLCLPGIEDGGILAEAEVYCRQRRAFLIVDAPVNSNRPNLMVATFAGPTLPKSDHAGVFFPWTRVSNPLNGGALRLTAPCGSIAGLFARIDSNRGVWKAPAGTEASLKGVRRLEYTLTDLENGLLNPLGVNCLRTFPDAGSVSWGSRTLAGADSLASEWKYIPIRRTALFIEESLYRGLKWVVFEPNDEPLWAQIRLNVGAFMHNLFRQGAFQGIKKNDAYFVKCDHETTTQNDIDLGRVNIWVGFAPLKPAEFVILYLQQMAGNIQV